MEMSVTRHSRKSEYEADSLGLIYYLKTGYDPFAPLQAMRILGKVDKGLNGSNIDFKKHFGFKDFNFKDGWTSYSTPNLVYASLTNDIDDTLRTHPDTKRRAERLMKLLGITEAKAEQFRNDKGFSGQSRLASLEIINSHYHFGQYGRALFCSLLLADSLPQNPYLHAMIAKSIYQLYKAQKDHNLDDVLELPDPRFDDNYNRFLSFINKLRLHELAHLCYEYATNQRQEFYSNEEFIHALWLCSRFDFSKVDSEKVAQEYEQLYPQGKYINAMKSKK
jgi:hypothetical protein